MHPLIAELSSKYGITGEQASGILDTIKEYVTSKYPAFGNSINLIFNENTPHSAVGESSEKEGVFAKATHFVEDHIPGGLKEKAEEIVDGTGGKIKNLFS